MHILLIHQAFAALNEPGGTRHHELANYLIEAGHRVTVIASPVSYLTGSQQKVEGAPDKYLTIKRAYTYSGLHRSFVHRIFSFLSFMFSSFFVGLRVSDVDLIWGTSPPIFQGLTAWVLSRIKRAPFLFEVRDLWPAFAIAVGVLTNPILISASNRLERFLYQRADSLIINSPGFREHIQSRGVENIVLLPNGADIQMFNPENKGFEFRQFHGLEDKFIALYAGAHGMSNDLDILLDAADLLRDRPEIAIVLLGDGKEKANLQSRAAEMHLANITFVDPIPKTKMPEVLASADACIAILKPIAMYKTVYPNKVFDYMAAGRPVVLAIDGVIRDVVESASGGIFVPPGDSKYLAKAIRTLADNPRNAQKLGQNGRRYVELHFDRREVAAQLTMLIESIIVN
ncbi:MAG: glycosyltransferase family 4 protein [Anaerolineae bacterium]|nr:glycosyltransferase family 4 protein [Anaerolineae bacterium]